MVRIMHLKAVGNTVYRRVSRGVWEVFTIARTAKRAKEIVHEKV